MHNDTQTEYALVSSELPSLRVMLIFQNTFQLTTPMTSEDIKKFFTMVEWLSGNYPDVKNSQCLIWYNSFFNGLVTVDKVDIMYQVFKYRRYVHDTGIDNCPYYRGETKWYNWWYTYHHGWKYWDQDDQDTITDPGVGLPGHPANWRTMADTLLMAWGDSNPSETYINKGVSNLLKGVNEVHASEDKVMNNWTGISTVTGSISSLWSKQKADLVALKALTTMDNKSYLFLLHLLIGLATGDTKMTTFVNKLVVVNTSTEAYPNEKFINQLTYFVLMYLGDIRETDVKYGWNNEQLQTFVRDLISVINKTTSASPGSTAIVASLNLQLGLLSTISYYPLIDPESSQPLSERKSDTRAALNRALKATPIEA
ncbi:hypothetical protein SAMN05428988_4500 [Chitinophaga sp. YR573]|uniref:hypothetical protein n=1 Tax=Chitinophaga sp. YR573 TaxID=1881040 RepID=UPI0008C55EF6|nr:hypothetical protein [Chitinophaga sp. YR573]SEW36467.1 hypothetical protein SAMN05428988_4500 [Chitinophaga sp. YR573]